jgi:hypothetical protein
VTADTSTLEEIELDVDGSPKYAHLAEKTSVTEGYVLGTPIMAVCGKVFVPSRDPKKFPICPICKEIVDALFLSDIE